MTTKKYKVAEIIETLRKENENETIEGQLLKPKLIRELYKQLGMPKREDFKDEYETARVCGWTKHNGYTKYIEVMSEREMKMHNNEGTEWRITYASETKKNIEDRYTRAGWQVTVQAYNVICRKFVKHPKYKNLWVMFYSSRDCAKYEYIIERGE